MKKRKWFALPGWLTLLIVVAAAALLTIVFSAGNFGLLAYFSYLFSVYALIVGVSGLLRMLPKIGKAITGSRLMEKLHGNPHVARYMEDPIHRTKLNLYLSVVVNIAYIFIKLIAGILYRSEWLVAFALYYVVLTSLRMSLVNYIRRSEIKSDTETEYRRLRLTGVLLLPMTVALSIIAVRMIVFNESADYPGVLIYGMAAYVFYAVILAVINVLRSRKHGSPVLSAVKVVNLTAALVALLGLEAAMLLRFGGDDPSGFRQRMLGISGLIVSMIILGLSGYMIIRSSIQLRKMEAKQRYGIGTGEIRSAKINLEEYYIDPMQEKEGNQ